MMVRFHSNKLPGVPLAVILVAACLVGCISCNQQPRSHGWNNQPGDRDGGADVEAVDADGTELDARIDEDGTNDGGSADTEDGGDADDAAVNCQS